MRKRIRIQKTVLDFLEKYGLGKPVREVYRHSVQGQIYYHITRMLLPETKIVRKLGDSDLIIDMSNLGVEKDLFLHNLRERESTKLLKETLEDGMNVLEIGANIGYYAIIEADHVGKDGSIIAVEPTPRNYDLLKKNVTLNQYENVSCIRKALGSEIGKSKMKISQAPNRNRISNSELDEEKVEVELTTADEVASNIELDIVRMDVEGYELQIMKSMNEILENDQLKMFLEIHPEKMEEFYDDDVETLWELLAEHDFRIKHLVRHPLHAKPSYFLRRNHAPRKVLHPDMPIEKALEKFPDFFEAKSTFRVFLEK